MNYVIIGNSAAAIGCIEGIRKTDKVGKITLISSEIQHTYSRPLISYLLLGKTTYEKMKYRKDDFYKKNKVECMLGRTVTKINKDSIVIDEKETITFDKLLVATGSRAFVPPMKGLYNVKNQSTFMSLDDAEKVKSMINEDSKVLIIGAGLIGLKCAEGIKNTVKSIDVVDLADRILPSILDVKGSKRVKNHIENQGIKFHLKASSEVFTENKCTLTNGKTIDFDCLIIAVGVRPNTEMFKELGGKVNRGIIINEKSETSIKNIYSAGDCSEGYDISAKLSRILAILPNAYLQGECAGVNMAGGDMKFNQAIPMNAIGFMGLHMVTAGVYEGKKYIKEDEENYKVLFYEDNLLKGYIMIGDVSRSGIYTSLIRNQIPLDTIDFDLIKEKPQLLAFTKEERNKLING